MPKQKTGKHAPLGAVIIADRTARPTMRTKMRIARKEEEETLEEVRTALRPFLLLRSAASCPAQLLITFRSL
jgi:hypothetical protein